MQKTTYDRAARFLQLNFLLMMFLMLMAGLGTAMPTAEAARIVGDWRYSTSVPMGTFEEDVSRAAQAGIGSADWTRYDFPHQPSLPRSAGQVWLTTQVTSENPDDNTLLFATTNQSLRVWLGDILLYEYGDVTSVRGVPGVRWHLVTLPPFTGTLPLTFELRSGVANYHLGYMSGFSLGTKFDQARNMAINDAPYLLSLPVAILIVMVLLTYYFNQSGQRGLYRALIILLLMMIALMIAQSNVKNLLLDEPLLWWHVTTVCFIGLTLLCNVVLQEIVDERWRRGFRYIYGYYTVVWVVALLAELAGFDGIEYGKNVTYISIITVNTPAFYWVLRSIMNGNRYCRYIVLPTIGVVGTCTFDGFAIHMHMIPAWTSEILSLGVYTFVFFIFFIIKEQMLREMNLETKIRQLQSDIADTVRRSLTDELTGCPNKAAFNDYIHKYITQQGGQQLVLMMFDIDLFKAVNDNYGHDVGDEVLKKFVALLQRIVDQDGRIFRWGGEEFVVACEDMLVSEGYELAEGVRHAMAAEQVLPDRQVTVSAGVASWHGRLDSPDMIFERMDHALYRAKNGGRNRVNIEMETEIKEPKNLPAPEPEKEASELALPQGKLLGLLLVFAVGLAGLFVSSGTASAAQLSGNWQYRVGNGSQTEIAHMPWSAIHEPSAWQHVDFPHQPPLQEGTRVLWMTTTLTDVDPQADTLMFMAASESVRVWIDQQLIYESDGFGDSYREGGNHWHLIILPQRLYTTSQLTFELHSHDVKKLGAFQFMRIDNETQQIQRLFWFDLPLVLAMPVAVILLLILLVYAHFSKDINQELCRACVIFLFVFAVWCVSAGSLKSVLFQADLFWWYVLSISAYLLPITANMILYELMKDRPYAHMKLIIAIFSMLFIIAMTGEMLGEHTMNSMMFYYYPMLLIFEGLAFVWLFHTAFHYHDRMCQAVLVPTVAFTVLGFIDGLSRQLQFSTWHSFVTPFGIYAFVYFAMAMFREHLIREHQLAAETSGLQQQAQIATERSERDELTGCYNRIKLNELLAAAIARAMSHKDKTFCLLMLDIDHFKAINDTYGHDRGDEVLRGFADRLTAFGDQYPCVRWGGEEFMMIFHGSLSSATIFGEVVRSHIERSPINGLPVTVSIGVASWHGEHDTPEALFHRVDSAIYLAKNGGRNMVCDERDIVPEAE